MKVLGFTESMTVCDCGKQGLKGTYVVETEDGETLHLGSSCVKKNWNLTQKEFTAKVDEGKKAYKKLVAEHIKEAYDEFRKVATQYPTVNQFTPDAEGYETFMKAYEEYDKKRIEAKEKYSF